MPKDERETEKMLGDVYNPGKTCSGYKSGKAATKHNVADKKRALSQFHDNKRFFLWNSISFIHFCEKGSIFLILYDVVAQIILGTGCCHFLMLFETINKIINLYLFVSLFLQNCFFLNVR